MARNSKLDRGTLTEYSVPISAVKIGAQIVTVFTVNGENLLVAHPVILGPILGEKIIIKEGVEADMEIVVDARGLREGVEVSLIPSLEIIDNSLSGGVIELNE